VIALYDPDGWALLLHTRTGEKVVLEPAMGFLWGQLEHGLTLRAAVGTLQQQLPASAALEQAIAEGVRELQRHQMLTTPRRANRGAAASLITHQPTATERVVAHHRPLPLRHRLAALAGFALAIVIVHLPIPFWAQLRLVSGFGRLRRQHPRLATTTAVVAYVRRITKPYPFWADCDEIALGAYVALALTGRAPDYCWGARFGQLDRHAWLEDHGTAIDHIPVTTDRPYQCVIRIGRLQRAETA
jgi:hypothetical protein